MKCLRTSGSVCWCLFVSFCLWMSGGVSIDLGDIFGMPELLGSVFGDSLHEGFTQTGANSLFWQLKSNSRAGILILICIFIFICVYFPNIVMVKVEEQLKSNLRAGRQRE